MVSVKYGMIAAALLFGSMLSRQAAGDEHWVALTDPDEVTDLVSGRAVDGKYWAHYYRADGVMAYYYNETKSVTLRTWEIDEEGRLCSAIYGMPEHVIDCFTFMVADDDPPTYQMKWSSGLSAFEFFDEPPQEIVDAVNEGAGPEN